MRPRFLLYFAAVLAGLMLGSIDLSAQFKEDAFTQNYQDPNDTTSRDTTDKLFSFAEYFGGVAHKRNVRIGVLFAGSTVFIGGQQIHNRDYWKLPIFYGGIAAGLGTGTYFKIKYNQSKNAYEAAYAEDPSTTLTVDENLKKWSNWSYVGAGLFYWSMLMDGNIWYKPGEPAQHPGRATIYSILLPGLGQAYNGEYWKIPLYWGLMAGSAHFYMLNNTNYRRYKRIHNEATTPDVAYTGPISGETAKYYRDVFRRYRDYSAVAFMFSYLLQVIDANVFSYMLDFEVTDDISWNMGPAILPPDNGYAFATGSNAPAVGMSFGLRF